MGYLNKAFKASCGNCHSAVLWRWTEPSRGSGPSRWRCEKCGSLNILDSLKPWPNVPTTIYLGHEKHHQMKLYPVPPESPSESWAQPYSIRSFVSQASTRLGGCLYTTSRRGEVMGEPVYEDRCCPPEAREWEPEWSSCHMVAGWTIGEASCLLWEKVRELCQTDNEAKFLHWYLGLAKDRTFPMLIPQARIGIAERRRPDFVAFVPFQYWKYKWYAIQLDKGHPEEMAPADELRDTEIAVHGYEVISLRPEKQGYLEEVKRLVERFEHEMNIADSDPWGMAVEVKVKHTEPKQEEEEIPF
jgi:hypothetical protein